MMIGGIVFEMTGWVVFTVIGGVVGAVATVFGVVGAAVAGVVVVAAVSGVGVDEIDVMAVEVVAWHAVSMAPAKQIPAVARVRRMMIWFLFIFTPPSG